MGAVMEAPDWVEGAPSCLPPPCVPRMWGEDANLGSSQDKCSFSARKALELVGPFVKVETTF